MMKTGLLVCDHLLPQYHEIHTGYPAMFRALLPELDFVDYFLCDGQFPESLDECDAWLMTGSSKSVYDDIDWIKQSIKLVKDIHRQKRKFVGICFGHQMMAEALGGKVRKSQRGWCVGGYTFEVNQQSSWMVPKAESIRVLMSCQDQVEILPADAEVLASNEMCPHGIISIGASMIGIQGHPEFSKAYSEALMRDRIARIGAKIVKEGLEGLDQPLDVGVLASWITNFIRG